MSVREIFYDCETRSTVDLRAQGVHRYVASQSTEVLCITYALDSGPVKAWHRGEPVPVDLAEAISSGALIYIHNAEFDVTVYEACLQRRSNEWPRIDYGQVRCTAAMAAAMGLPRSLDGAAHALQLGIEKDGEGRKLMLRMCKPRGFDDDLKPLWHESRDDLQRLASYGAQDVQVLRTMRRRMLDLRPDEQRAFELTCKLNARGVRVDVPAVRKAFPLVQQASAELRKRVNDLTHGEVETPNQRNRLLGFINDYVYNVPNARRKTLELFRAVTSDLPDVVSSLIALRLEAAKTSTAKLQAMLARADSDWRLRGAMIYHGAATGRFSSVGVQLQNLPRPTMTFKECCLAVEYITQGMGRDELGLLFGPTLQLVSDCLRSFFIPSRGHGFSVADFSKIEAIVNAWCAGQLDLLQAFKEGRDTYCEMASDVFGRTITKADTVERQIGKVLILACGYGMGWKRFWETCVLDGIPISPELAEQAIKTYRGVNDKIVEHWWVQEAAAIDAALNPGKAVTCGVVTWLVRSGILFCRLPSGRALSYPYPTVRDRLNQNGNPQARLHYWGIDSFTHRWAEISTYGAALVENIVQAIARDLLLRAMFTLDAQGVSMVLTVHDEIVSEGPDPDADLRTMMDVMRDPPDWGHDIPINAAGEVLPRYGKLG